MPIDVDPYVDPMFTGNLDVLSNFYMHDFYVPGIGWTVKSNEHLFNALKFEDVTQQKYVLDSQTPGEAKRRGRSRKMPIRLGWDTGGRVRAMQTGLVAKFLVNELRDVLLSTGDMKLVETNRHHDNFWGDCIGGGRRSCPSKCELPGTNMLGELLMALRCRLS